MKRFLLLAALALTACAPATVDTSTPPPVVAVPVTAPLIVITPSPLVVLSLSGDVLTISHVVTPNAGVWVRLGGGEQFALPAAGLRLDFSGPGRVEVRQSPNDPWSVIAERTEPRIPQPP